MEKAIIDLKEIKETLAVEKETYNNGGESDDIVLGWIEALEYVLRITKVQLNPILQIEEMARSWSDDDQYALDVQRAIGNLEYSIGKHNGVSGISGGYCMIEILDKSTDVFDDHKEEEIDNFHLSITFGVKSDCDNWNQTYYRRMNCSTLEIINDDTSE